MSDKTCPATMEALLKNEVVRSKIKGLSPPVKKAFIESLLDLYEQETEEMIDVIEESRMELRGDFLSFEDESKSLRAESRMLEEKRGDHDKECVDRYVKSRAMSSRSSDSRLSYIDEQTNSMAVKDYIKKRGKRRPPLADEIKRSHSSDRPPDRRADSVMSTRSLPTPANLRTVEEEKDEVMKNLSSANRQTEAERQRQAELIAQRREKRLQQKKTTEEKALELLEKAVAMDKMLQDQKQEQDQKLKERLEDMKRKRAESRIGSRDEESRDKESRRESRDRNVDRKTDEKERNGSDAKSSQDKPNKTEKSDKKDSSEREEKREEKREKTKREEKKEKDKKVDDYDFTIY